MGEAAEKLHWVDEPDYQARLMVAGYVHDEHLELWINAVLDRALDARIAAVLTPAQLDAWIAAAR
jgi:hypothetical protein